MIECNMTAKDNLKTNLDENFEEAYNLCDKEFSHQDLLSMLYKGNLVQKQIAALKFDYVNDSNDANALVSNLTGCDGKIREAAALTINKFINTKPETRIFFAEIGADTFADASIDINGNICNYTVDSADKLKEFENFSTYYIKKIIQISKNTLDEIDKFIFRDKKYVINKQIFKLYWCLKTIKNYFDYMDYADLKEILERSSKQKEYTIREAVAHIIKNKEEFNHIKEKLEQDDNYYVKKALL